jgi:hypothetical protein
MPAVTGHDYPVMRADYGMLYMSEVVIGLPLPPYFVAALCDVVLCGRRLRVLR